ncbi:MULTISPECIES: phage holin [Bhargavaea]|uniref:Phage holin n=1 Tax=Bhargavaea changchunensis TaxID=2134037 RepID=A0ABW2NEI7_9BACL|nr:phage holin [Bhargavaea sp. CC-171006]
MDPRHAALARLFVLLFLIVNQTLITLGWSPLPFDEQEVEAGVNAVLLAAASVWAWWKNSPMTQEARKVQEELERRKRIKKGEW